ncbi:MAG: hypothetical protein ACC742_05280 [Thermoanaerobaculales bacterium]
MRMKSIQYVLGAMTLAVFFGVPAAVAQSDHTGHDHQGATQQGAEKSGEHHGDEAMEKGEMTDVHQKMMQKSEQMKKHCKMMDAKVDELANAMNSAEGESKIEAMTALLNELVSQRKMMHEKMMKMRGKMMSKMSCGKDDGASMSKCKMMMEKKEEHEHGESE